MKTIIYQHNENNGVCILSPSPTWDGSLEELAEKDVPLNTPYKIMDSLNIDGVFFNAYEFDQEVGTKINISKAKDVWLNNYRKARKPLFEKLDVDFMRAVEVGNVDLQKEIAVKKQALRDVTKTELPDTLEGIKNTWPEILGEKPF